MKNYIFTSESITEGHPDKICDRIADSILDEALRQDPASKMAVEATIKDDFVLIYGEANTKAKLEYEEIAKEVIPVSYTHLDVYKRQDIWRIRKGRSLYEGTDNPERVCELRSGSGGANEVQGSGGTLQCLSLIHISATV